MKHTNKRLLAFLLVLAMGFAMVPMLALTAGAETAIVSDIQVGTDGAIQDLDWSIGFIGSDTNIYGWRWETRSEWSGEYRYSEIVNVPKAGTTLVWSEHAANANGDTKTMSKNAFALTSWKEVAPNEWEVDRTGANVYAFGAANTENQYYDEATKTITYFYTTTKDNEKVRFGCMGYTAEGKLANSAAQCPKVYVYTPAFVEGETAGAGTIANVKWFQGYVGSHANTDGSVSAIKPTSTAYAYSMPITVPTAGTTVTFTDPGANRQVASIGAYVFSTWKVGDDGLLDMFYGCEGGYENNAWTTINEDGSYTYSYTTTYDNEIIRLCHRNDDVAELAVSFVLDNAANVAPVLAAAGYDPAQVGTPYMAKWYAGLFSVESDSLVLGSPAYSFSNIVPVYGKGTTVTVVDVMNDETAGTGNFATNDVYTVAKFDGAGFTGNWKDSEKLLTMTEGVVTGSNVTERDAAVQAGKAVYTYTTTEHVEFLRVCVANTGNTVNGHFVSPIIYISTPGSDSSYAELEGLNIVALGDSYLHGGGAVPSDTWFAQLAKRYNMNYTNYGIDGSTVSAALNASGNKQNPMVERYEDMADEADIVIFEGGRNDYNVDAPLGEIGVKDPTTFLGAVQIILDGLQEKYPNALIVCVTAWDLTDLEAATGLGSNRPKTQGLCTEDYATAFADYVDSLQNERICVLRSYDNEQMPVFMKDNAFRSLYCVGKNDISHLNANGHKLVLEWFETFIGDNYKNYAGMMGDNSISVQFAHGEETVAIYGTAAKDRIVNVPAVPGVSNADVFGWIGTVTNGETTTSVLLNVGEQVTFKQGDVAVLTPLVLDMDHVLNPMLRLNGTTGLRFTTAVSQEDYTALLSKIGAGELGQASLTLGMLIVPAQYVSDIGGKLTHAGLDEWEKARIDVTSTIADNGDGTYDWYDYDEETGMGYIAGTINEILPQNHTKKFTATGYAKLTIEGEDHYLYAENGGLGGDTIYNVATKALEDTSDVQDDTYQYEVGEGSGIYSPYTAEQREVLGEYVGNVIVLETITDSLYNVTTAKLTSAASNADWMGMTVVGGGDVDSLTDIFYPYAPPATGSMAVNDISWYMLTTILGSDEVTSLYIIGPAEDGEAPVCGGILLDGFVLKNGDEASSVLCVKYVVDGDVFYIIGFNDYAINY